MPNTARPQTNNGNGNGANLGYEAELFKAADKLRGSMEPSDYKHVVLGLIFLKHITDRMTETQLPATIGDRQKNYTAINGMSNQPIHTTSYQFTIMFGVRQWCSIAPCCMRRRIYCPGDGLSCWRFSTGMRRLKLAVPMNTKFRTIIPRW
jgi:hypothetical protein